jgi:hypothetical protein
MTQRRSSVRRKSSGFCQRCLPHQAQHYRQYGQALTEFLVVALALIPLILLIPLIAKYQDVSYAVQMASRYVAFEATTRNDEQSTWKTPAQLNEEVRRRFFSNPDAPVKTGDVAGNFTAHQNMFWRGPTGAPLIANFDKDVAVGFGAGDGDGDGGGATQNDAFSATDDGKPFNQPKTADWLGLRARGIYTGNVSITLANVPAGLKAYTPLDKINLSVTRHTSLVVDGWTARDAEQVESRIDHPMLVPATKLRAVSSVVGASVSLVEGGHIDKPQLGQLDFWRDIVPPDRLK